MSATKILTIGPPAGRIKDLIAKVGAIQAKHGPFTALFVLGDLFSIGTLGDEEEELLNGKLTLPIPTYIYQGSRPLDASLLERIEAVDRLTYLGKSGVSVTPQGLRVAFCGGTWDSSRWAEPGSGPDEESPFVTEASIDKLLSDASFSLPKPLPQAARSTGGAETLAAAKAQAAVQSEAETRSNENAAILDARPPIDLLLTNCWPSGVTLLSTAPLPHESARVWGCPPVASLAKAGTPRYHFSLAPDHDSIVGLDTETQTTGAFWEREPYLNDLAAGAVQGLGAKKYQTVTRFISLARFGNAKKVRWFMALNLTPGASPAKPSNVTPSPFFTPSSSDNERKRAAETGDGADGLDSGPNFRWSDGKKAKTGGERGDGPPPPGYVCKICGSTEHYIRLCPQKSAPRSAAGNGSVSADGVAGLPAKPKREAPIPVGPEDCWFCLSNPKCAKHLIVSIGTECYVALPKGQLPPAQDPANPVPGGGHVLIVPMSHYGNVFDSDIEVRADILAETREYRDKLQRAYAKFDAVPVAWELGRSASSGSRVGHTHIQVMPVPSGCKDQVVPAFEEAAARSGYEFTKEQAEIDAFFGQPSGEDFFWLDLNGSQWLLKLGKGGRFNMQFARQTLAHLLGVPDRADWKVCAQPDAIEKQEAAAFKEILQEFEDDA